MKRASSHQEHMDRLNLAVHLENITVAFNNKPVLIDIDLEVKAGTIMGIIGPNDSGKSILLKTIIGIVKPCAGSIHIFSRTLNKTENDIAYIPQLSSVNWNFPVTVSGFVSMGLYNNRRKYFRNLGTTKREFTNNALKQTDLYNISRKSIQDLSKGEQARLLLARALVQNARVFIMDEPLTLADSYSADIINDTLKDLKSKEKTLIVTHHDIITTPSYFDQVTLINHRKISTGNLNEIYNSTNLKETYGTYEPIISKQLKG